MPCSGCGGCATLADSYMMSAWLLVCAMLFESVVVYLFLYSGSVRTIVEVAVDGSLETLSAALDPYRIAYTGFGDGVEPVQAGSKYRIVALGDDSAIDDALYRLMAVWDVRRPPAERPSTWPLHTRLQGPCVLSN